MGKKIRKRNKGSLFKKYFASSVIAIMVGFMFLGFLMMVFISALWWDDKVETLSGNVKNIAQAYTVLYNDSMVDESKKATDEAVLCNTLKVMSDSTLSDYYISDVEGNITYCGSCFEKEDGAECALHGQMKISDDYISRAVAGGFSDYTTEGEFGQGRFVVGFPLVIDSQTVAIVFAAEDALEGLVPYIMSIFQSFSYAVIIALIIVFILIYSLARGITEPLSEMKEITKHYAKGDFEYKANENYKKRDFREFAKALNKMGTELKNNEESRKSFVANVSHELKTPMTSIGGFIDGILDGTIPPDQERKYLSIVSNEVKRLSRMVVSMLNLSKIEAGEVRLAPKNYDVVSQIFGTLLTFEKKIEEKKIEIIGFEDLENVIICADKDLVQQVIYNLIDNAVKFTPEKGTITVKAVNDGQKTTVSIRNSGAGVSEEEISRIFERFYKVDKSRSFDIKGVGLGLYIVKTIINMHDGEIYASSKQGEYTEFSFEIPLS